MTEAERLAAHLRDLAPEDLPDSQRETTLSSIAAFRERSMKKQTERRELDRQIEERRQAMLQRKQQQQQPRSSAQTDPASSNSNAARPDPQSFNQPIGFVAQEGNQEHPGREPPEIDDAKRERERVEQEQRQQEQVFKDVRCSLGLTVTRAGLTTHFVSDNRGNAGSSSERGAGYKRGSERG